MGGARDLARHWGASPLLIGLTVVAFGTSLPELFVALAASWRGVPEIMLGNVIGSNIANIGLILAISLLVSPLSLRFRSVATEMALLHLATAGLFALTLLGYFPAVAGWLSVALLIIYTFVVYRRSAVANAAAATAPEPLPVAGIGKSLLLVAFGLVALAGGSEMFLRGAVEISRALGVSELVIGLTLAAIGTSLPELATCFAALRQRQDALLVGNIIGSNLFNLLMVLGVTGVVLPFALPASLLRRDLPVMAAFSLVLLLLISWRGRLGRLLGAGLLAAYGGYLYLLV